MSTPSSPDDEFDEAPDNSEQPPPDDEEEYEVGYKKPPKEHQFRKGNTLGKGRPKGAKNTRTIVNEALGVKVTAKIGGKQKQLTKIEAAMHQLANKASSGDLKAIEKLIQLQERYGPQEDPEGPPKEKLQRDLSALEKYLEMKAYFNPDEEDDNE